MLSVKVCDLEFLLTMRNNDLIGEVGDDIAQITWKVHLVNKKPEWDKFIRANREFRKHTDAENENFVLAGKRLPRKKEMKLEFCIGEILIYQMNLGKKN